MENFNVATAMETVRDGHWLLPYLQGVPRTKKPPLTEWITALGLLSSRSREWGARWPTLLMASLTLPSVYLLGRLVGGWRLGLISALIAGSSALWLKYGHMAFYDVQLASWVILCNALLACVILRRGRVWYTVGAGTALGLALMTKGPPAYLETLAPAVLFVLWRHYFHAEKTRILETRRALRAILVAILVSSAIALPWTIYVVLKVPNVTAQWIGEMTLREEARFETRIGWHGYLVLIPAMFPWITWFIAGLCLAAGPRKINPRIQLILFWLLVPILVMTFFPERRDRYLLPMVGPTAVVAAWGMLELTRRWREWLITHFAHASQWIQAAIAAAAPAIAGGTTLRNAAGVAWLSPIASVSLALLCVGIVAVVWSLCHRRPGSAIAVSVTTVMISYAVIQHGYAKSAGGHSEARIMVGHILHRQPDARVVNANSRGVPLEFAIYLNRVVPTIEDINELQPADKATVVLVRAQEIPSAPAGFTLLDSMIVNKELWNAYLLPQR